MRFLLALCAIALCVVVPAAAQDNTSAPAATTSASVAPSPPQRGFSSEFPWQVGVSYEYVRFRVPGGSFNLHGFNTSIVRYAGNWFGLEGDVSGDFGTIPKALTATFVSPPSALKARLVLYSAGPRLAYRGNARIQPWVHALFGGAHARITQTAKNPNTFNVFGMTAGGGVDIKVGPRASWRVEGDYLGTRFAKVWQKSVTIKSGIVFNF